MAVLLGRHVVAGYLLQFRVTDVLANKQIAGAGLDVFTAEPLPQDSKYHELDNVVLTSHLASSTFESFWSTYKSAIDIADNVFNGIEDSRLLV